MGDRRTGRKRTLIAAGLAVLAHITALWTLGWRSPRVGFTPAADNGPAVEIQLMPRPPRSAAASGSASAPGRARKPAIAAPGPALAAAEPSTAQQVDAGGAADCEPEDLPLLTDAERLRCRNEIGAQNAREAARTADARLARRLASLSTAPHVDSIPEEKRAYYDAVAAAYDQQSHGPPMAGHTPGPGCSIKFSGLTIVKSKPPPHSLHLGPCFIAPPQGFLTEESRVEPP